MGATMCYGQVRGCSEQVTTHNFETKSVTLLRLAECFEGRGHRGLSLRRRGYQGMEWHEYNSLMEPKKLVLPSSLQGLPLNEQPRHYKDVIIHYQRLVHSQDREPHHISTTCILLYNACRTVHPRSP